MLNTFVGTMEQNICTTRNLVCHTRTFCQWNKFDHVHSREMFCTGRRKYVSFRGTPTEIPGRHDSQFERNGKLTTSTNTLVTLNVNQRGNVRIT
jgi:hypothetical protein